MTDSSIMFSAPMIHALRAGRKTMTRRLASSRLAKLQPGARVWVRENYWQTAFYPGALPSGEATPRSQNWGSLTQYAADGRPANTPNRHYPEGLGGNAISAPDPYSVWLLRPSIHMPRTLSRITLSVLSVHEESLDEITAANAKAEGLAELSKDDGRAYKFGIPDRDGWPGKDDCGMPWDQWDKDPRVAFRRLWERLHGKGSWQENPRVAVIRFDVSLANIDAKPQLQEAA